MLVAQKTIVFFLGNKFKFSSAVLIFGSKSMVASNNLLGLGYNTFNKTLRSWQLDNFSFSRVCAQKLSTYNNHTYSHHLWNFEV